MLAVAYFAFFFLFYLPLCLYVTIKGYSWADRKYRRGWIGALTSIFIMYNLVFWDWIPAILIHKHLCETQAGFWVYKTPEQWVQEHPEVKGQDWSDYSKWPPRLEMFDENFNLDESYHHAINRYWHANSLYTDVFRPREISMFGVYKTMRFLFDAKTNEILFYSVNFSRGGTFNGGNYKLWLNAGTNICSEEAYKGVENGYQHIIKLVKGDIK